MYNSDTPLRAELPTSRQLARSTLVAAISAAVILIIVVLPAEYGIDPTGMGGVLRLTEMGKIKKQLAAAAAADAAPQANATPEPRPAAGTTAPIANAAPAAVATKVTEEKWRDEIPFTLPPGEGLEIKLKMTKGAKAQFSWLVKGGVVNYDTHGDGGGRSISYEKGRGVPSDEGVLEAAFDGNHGWFWRNRGQSDVNVILRTRGDYTDIKRVR
jgi:hypothetical protein